MKFADWVSQSSLSREEIGARLGVAKATINKLCSGQEPGGKLARRIEVLTTGIVMLKDLIKEEEG